MMVSNKCLVMILVSCLLLSLVLPAIEAAKTRRTKAGVRRNRARIANSRKAQARALRARQIASKLLQAQDFVKIFFNEKYFRK